MKLMEKILRKENLQIAVKKVKQNKGAPGVDKMIVDEVETWFEYKLPKYLIYLLFCVLGLSCICLCKDKRSCYFLETGKNLLNQYPNKSVTDNIFNKHLLPIQV